MSRIVRAIEALIYSPEEIANRRLNYIRDKKDLKFIRRIELDLGVARTQFEIKVFGDMINVERIDGEIDVYFNDDMENFIELDVTRKFYMDFWRIFLTNTVQAGKTCVILIGREGTFDAVSDVARESKQDELIEYQYNYITASDDELINNTTPETNIGAVPTMIKEFEALFAGEYRISFDIQNLSDADDCYGRIYRNGVAYGISRTNSVGPNSDAWSEDLLFSVGDLIQLYIWGDAVDTIQNVSFMLRGTTEYRVARENVI